jgi:hypothetical protein
MNRNRIFENPEYSEENPQGIWLSTHKPPETKRKAFIYL